MKTVRAEVKGTRSASTAHNDGECAGQQLPGGRPRRVHPGAGNDQRLRRAVRQCEPDARVMADLELKLNERCSPGGTTVPPHRHLALRRRDRQPCTRMSTWRSSGSPRSRTREASTLPPCAAPRARISTVDPELVGNRMRIVISELSGRGNVVAKAEEHGSRRA
ncbi:MAG: hypothetical protein MZV64_49075 [Ignavibacteriales bacterium]|nr:hypothetical protein [Ignavibacteriales bacterium]